MNTQFNENIRPEWGPERAALCVPENFVFTFPYLTPQLRLKLTNLELKRLEPKLELIRHAAAKMAANMAKGTLKYKADDWPVDAWLDYLADDATDTLNYVYLLKDAYEQEKRARES